MAITKRCKIRIDINVDYANEVECEVAPLDACELMFGNHKWGSDVTFHKKESKYRLVKGGKAYLIKVHKGRGRISLLATKQGQTSKLIETIKKQASFIFDRVVDLGGQV